MYSIPPDAIKIVGRPSNQAQFLASLRQTQTLAAAQKTKLLVVVKDSKEKYEDSPPSPNPPTEPHRYPLRRKCPVKEV